MDRGEGEGVRGEVEQFGLVIGKAAARAAERKARTENDRVPDAFCRGDRLFDRVGDLGRDNGFADTFAEFLELLAVLGFFDALAAGAEQFDVALAEDALLFQLHREVQPCLSADARQDRVGALVANDLRDVLERQRFHVDLVGDRGVGHDGRGVGVDEDDFVPLFFEREARLRPGVVELRRLPDDDRSRTDDHDLFDVVAFHISLPVIEWFFRVPSALRCRRRRSGRSCSFGRSAGIAAGCPARST